MRVSIGSPPRCENDRSPPRVVPNATEGRVPIHFPHILHARLFPHAVPRHLDSLILKFGRRPGVVNVKDLGWASRPRRACTIRTCVKEGIIAHVHIRAT